ncbi:MAG TPA: YerC/YecD family TrpR-related protein [Gammaproteobacteria bacterium]|nr:YerC/YecD family TrpR-related protein [Gammaproteobacteria bacterium]
MKHHRSAARPERAVAQAQLFDAILTLRTPQECAQFFTDLCTPAELEALTDRWTVVGLLNDGLPYRRIHELTGVSVTTIGRVARFLSAGNGGYTTALKRLYTR